MGTDSRKMWKKWILGKKFLWGHSRLEPIPALHSNGSSITDVEDDGKRVAPFPLCHSRRFPSPSFPAGACPRPSFGWIPNEKCWGGGNPCPCSSSSDGPPMNNVGGDGGWGFGQAQDVEDDQKRGLLPLRHS